MLRLISENRALQPYFLLPVQTLEIWRVILLMLFCKELCNSHEKHSGDLEGKTGLFQEPLCNQL